MVAGGVPEGNGGTVKPCHFRIKPVAPLRVESIGIRGQADDFIAREENEFRLWSQALNNCVDRGKGLFVQ